MTDMNAVQPHSPQKSGEHGTERAVSKIINPAGSWEMWSEEMKQKLQREQDNTDVGQKIVFENDKIRIWDVRLKPGEALGFHKHELPYYRTAMTEGKSTSYYGDGMITEATHPIGETQYFRTLSEEDYFVHDLTNIGDTELIFSTVEILS